MTTPPTLLVEYVTPLLFYPVCPSHGGMWVLVAVVWFANCYTPFTYFTFTYLQLRVLSKRLDGSSRFLHTGFFRLITYCSLRIFECIKNKAGTLSKIARRRKIFHGTSTVESAVNLVRPTSTASLSHWASTCVYNTMGVSCHAGSFAWTQTSSKL